MAGGRISAILGYCPGKVGFGGTREPARGKLRSCVQISMPCGFKAERLCGAARVRAPEAPCILCRPENSQRGQAKFPRRAGWLGAFCVLVLWTAWDRDTVADKNIKAFELRELKLMDPTGQQSLSLESE